MKNILVLVFIALFGFVGCGDDKNEPKESRFVDLEESVILLQNDQPLPPELVSRLDDAKTLISRSNAIGYALIDSKSLGENTQEIEIIATVPRGIYNLGLIPNAKHFEFAKAMSLNENGSDWNWAADAKGEEMAKFLSLLGDDKEKLIVFYDEGGDIYAPAGSAHTAIIWAKHLGYNNLARLSGGYNAWKDRGNQISFEAPSCCQ